MVILIDKIFYFLRLTLEADVLWNVLPLAIATVLIIAYFERYKGEEMGWNTYFANSLVLLFVSISLLRFIYNTDSEGLINFADYGAESIACVALLGLGILISNFNFSHLLPERFVRYISSPLTINLIAYAIILFVYSLEGFSWLAVASLVIIVILLVVIFELIKLPLNIFFKYVKKEKEKEEIQSIKEQRFQIDELKRTLQHRKNVLNRVILREIERKRKKAIKEKKILKISGKMHK